MILPAGRREEPPCALRCGGEKDITGGVGLRAVAVARWNVTPPPTTPARSLCAPTPRSGVPVQGLAAPGSSHCVGWGCRNGSNHQQLKYTLCKTQSRCTFGVPWSPVAEQRSADVGLPVAGKPVPDGITVGERGEQVIDSLRQLRLAEDVRYRAEHPAEGLRARKRRLTRHLISDTATTMFASRGFDAVRVAEIADRANISLKTLYNYFPTKEAMVLDDTDELITGLATALRERPSGTSITNAVVAALGATMAEFDVLDDELAAEVATTFESLIRQTPALRACWLEILDRLAQVAAQQIAARSGTEPTDPEPMIAGRALAGLVQVDMNARATHIHAGRRGPALRDAVATDVRRAAQLLEAGLATLG